MERLALLRLRVRQGVEVDSALEFANYVLRSDMAQVMLHNPEFDVHLREWFPYDGNSLYREAEFLAAECRDYYRGRSFAADGQAAGASKSDLESIEAKLNFVVQAIQQHNSPRVKAPLPRKARLRILNKNVA